jgi:hypothetical protein
VGVSAAPPMISISSRVHPVVPTRVLASPGDQTPASTPIPAWRTVSASSAKPGSLTLTDAKSGRAPSGKLRHSATVASLVATSLPVIHRPVETPTGILPHSCRTAVTAAAMSFDCKDSASSASRGCIWIASAPAVTALPASAASSAGVIGTAGWPTRLRPPLRHTLIRLITGSAVARCGVVADMRGLDAPHEIGQLGASCHRARPNCQAVRTRSGSASSPARPSAAAPSPRSKSSSDRSATTSATGTPTPSPSPGLPPPKRSWPRSALSRPAPRNRSTTTQRKPQDHTTLGEVVPCPGRGGGGVGFSPVLVPSVVVVDGEERLEHTYCRQELDELSGLAVSTCPLQHFQ